jgi:hypothetical protein
MADHRVDGLLQSLGATFDAAIAREEEEAAADLAMSLRQDRSLADVLMRSPWRVVLRPGFSPRLDVVGPDHVVASGGGRHVIPLRWLEVTPDATARPPDRDSRLLVEVLRDVARSGRDVSVLGPGGDHRGVLRWVGTDHLALETHRGLFLLPLEGLRRLTVKEGEGG